MICTDLGTMAISAGGPILRVWDLLGASTSRSRISDVDGSNGNTSREVDGMEGEEEGEIDTGTSNCLKALSNHQKTITSLVWSETEGGEARVLSGGLDGLVKVYNPNENWKVKHTMRYGGQIMSLAVSVSSIFFLVLVNFPFSDC